MDDLKKEIKIILTLEGAAPIDASIKLTDKQIEQLGITAKNVSKGMENSFRNASIRFNNSLAKKSISEIEADLVKLRANFEKQAQLGVSYEKLKYLKQNIDEASSAVKTFGRTAPEEIKKVDNSFSSGFKSMITSMIAFFGIRQIINIIKDLVGQAGKFEEIFSAFKGNANDIALFRKAVKDTVDDMGLIKLSNQASDLGVSLKEQPLLFAMAKRAAEAYGTDTEEGFRRVVMATEGNIRGLRAVGVQKGIYEQIVKSLARAHGGLITEMDAETQKEIRMEALIKAAGMTLEEATRQAKSHADRMETVGSKWENLKLIIGQGLTPFFSGIFDWLGKIIDRIEILAGKVKVLGSPERSNAVMNSLKNYDLDQSTKDLPADKRKYTEINQEQLDKEKDASISRINAQKELTKTKGDELDILLAQQYPNKDKIKTLQSQLDISKAQLFNEQERLAILNSYKIGEKPEVKTGSDLTPEAIEARKQKEQGIENKFDAILLESGKINLEKQMAQSDAAIKNEYDKLSAAGKQKYNLQELQAVERKKIEEKYYADIINLIEQKAAADKLLPGPNDNVLKTEKEKFVELLKVITGEKQRTEVLTKIKSINDEIKNGDKEQIAFEQKHISDLENNEKAMFERKVSTYTLSVEDYKKYLNGLLELDIKKLQEQNRLTEEHNRLFPAKPLPLFDVDVYRGSIQSDNDKKALDYSIDQQTKIREEWKKTHKEGAAGMEMLNQGMSGFFSSWAQNTMTMREAWQNAWSSMVGFALSKLSELAMNSIWDYVLGIFGVATGGASTVVSSIVSAATGTSNKKPGNEPKPSPEKSVKGPVVNPLPTIMKIIKNQEENFNVNRTNNQVDNKIENLTTNKKSNTINAELNDVVNRKTEELITNKRNNTFNAIIENLTSNKENNLVNNQKDNLTTNKTENLFINKRDNTLRTIIENVRRVVVESFISDTPKASGYVDIMKNVYSMPKNMKNPPIQIPDVKVTMDPVELKQNGLEMRGWLKQVENYVKSSR